MGPLSDAVMSSGLPGSLDGASSASEKGGETLPGAAYIELYRTRQAIATKSRDARFLDRLREVVVTADRSDRSS